MRDWSGGGVRRVLPRGNLATEPCNSNTGEALRSSSDLSLCCSQPDSIHMRVVDASVGDLHMRLGYDVVCKRDMRIEK